MKPIIEQQSPRVATELVGCEVIRGPDFACVWHQHPEVEITLVKRGGTQRMVGDKISPLPRGDLVVIGPDLPLRVPGELPASVPVAGGPLAAGISPGGTPPELMSALVQTPAKQSITPETQIAQVLRALGVIG